MAYTLYTVVILETSVFTRQIEELLSDDEYALFQWELIERPKQGNIIRGSGGIRKVRCKVAGQGKRGGARIIYYWHGGQDQIYMLLAYAKNDQSDLTRDQVARLRSVVKQEFG